ncbi:MULTISPECIES: helix-turn-helix transcriptional regulator [Vibrio]|uniref:helix-turn-helix transcriptional regulator n=1 Tax=Vibrio TaxID=662 RepID=UPI0009B0E0C0|nr:MULTISPECIES: AlpA family phage regulatory protein [Vibrio]EGQ8608273.1 AlpA family phage regulatory protein [Vibrio parahaemolyticus]ELA8919478.1 AlpA family phage regulatory protein [Vibrio parahaemolyticus]ELM4052122.1 AlpA family phage regulatory protein [Vibrio parahaemolyticus]MBE4223001.1 AlpA family phage regulatory protein [Vibrio parahaemolyticus]MDF4484790.1 AlpA family phage regulatory protein [Vibrio parahaemolyticus]
MLKHSANTYNSPNKPTDRLIREDERRTLTSISRSQAWVLEQKGLFPKRIRLGSRSVAWRLSEILKWIETREGVQS